jgi:hypothetical protein
MDVRKPIRLFGQRNFLSKRIKKLGQTIPGIGIHKSIVVDPDPGSGAFLPQGSGIRNEFFPDPGSQT